MLWFLLIHQLTRDALSGRGHSVGTLGRYIQVEYKWKDVEQRYYSGLCLRLLAAGPSFRYSLRVERVFGGVDGATTDITRGLCPLIVIPAA